MMITPDMTWNVETINSILVSGLGTEKAAAYTTEDIKIAMDCTNKILNDCDKLNIKCISYYNKEFPLLVKETSDPPVLLYYKGNFKDFSKLRSVAVIGTREPTPFGQRVAENIGEALAKKGFAVVSGLAKGCDSGGHIGCLAGNGITAAILGTGLEKIYPAENKQLAENIIANNGCLISEYAPYSQSQRGNFVERDRLQSAFSEAVFVVETGEVGGTFHAVNFGKEYGRKIGCFLHSEKYASLPQIQGNIKLMKQGIATPIANNDDLERFLQSVLDNDINNKNKSDNKEEYIQLSFKLS